ncbi:hypothetical protein D557_3228 [Bordetella holmesii 70147]|nr:hypothetical protein D557_3228 [Bordetella holmesii 70147]
MRALVVGSNALDGQVAPGSRCFDTSDFRLANRAQQGMRPSSS